MQTGQTASKTGQPDNPDTSRARKDFCPPVRPDTCPDSRTLDKPDEPTSVGLSADELGFGGASRAHLTPDTLRQGSGRPASGAIAETAAARTAAHKVKLAADPRFACWVGLMAADDPPPDPAAERRVAERDELMRIACVAAIKRADAGQAVDPLHLEYARAFVACTPPLAGPLGTGEPGGTA